MKMANAYLLLIALIMSMAVTGCNNNSSSNNVSKMQMGGTIQGKPLDLTNSVTTFAGTPLSVDGIGTSARFNGPIGITSDGTNLYVADTMSHTIRKIVISTGATSTIAGTPGCSGSSDGVGAAAKFNGPRGITTDGTNLYITDYFNNLIRKLDIATGAVTTLAGTIGVSGATDGTGTDAKFYWPVGITTDGSSLYVSDSMNNSIRKILISNGSVSTLAGSTSSGSSDGFGTMASFKMPGGITTDGTFLYVADSSNCTIRKIVIASGYVSTLAGTAGSSGSEDGSATTARFLNPEGITSDGTNLYVADSYSKTIRKITISTGTVTTLTGSPASPAEAIDGPLSIAKFNIPRCITINGTYLYVADTNSNTIWKINLSAGTVTTLSGSTSETYGTIDGTGTSAKFYAAVGITTDGTNLYVSDTNNNTIRKIHISSGQVTTLAGTPGTFGSTDGIGVAASFIFPSAITTDGTNLYVTSNFTIRRIVISTGEVTTLAGAPGTPGSVDGIGNSARFDQLHGITTDGTNLFVSGDATIRKIEISTGVVTTLAGSTGNYGSIDGIGSSSRFNAPGNITTDGVNLFVPDITNNTIRKILISTGEVSTIAGTAGTFGSSDGIGTAASFNYPQGITTDGTNLYITDTRNNLIRKLVIATGVVTTIAGTGSPFGWADGTGAAAAFNGPIGITSDGINLFVADSNNNTIRKIR